MKQQFITIRPEDLLERVARFKKEGCRLVQILCTRTTEGFELTYTFDKNYFLYHLRLTAALGGSVMSITSCTGTALCGRMRSTIFSGWMSVSSRQMWTMAGISTTSRRRRRGMTCRMPSTRSRP